MATFFRRILNKRSVNSLVQLDRFIGGCPHRPVISLTNMTTRLYSSSSSSSSPSSTKKNNTTHTAPQKELHFVHVQHIHPRELAQSTFFALHRPLLTFGNEQMQQTFENGQNQQVWEEEDYEENSGSNANNAIPLANPLSPYLTTTPFHPNQPTISMSAAESKYVVNRFFSEIKLKFNQEQLLNNQKTTVTELEVDNVKQLEQSTNTEHSNTNPVVDLKLIEKATHALLKHEKVRPKLGNDLLSDGQPVNVWLIVSLFKFSDKPRLKPVRIPLKHPLYGSSTDICLITKDPQRTYKEWVAAHNVKWVQNVIGISKLRKKYIPYEAKRNLCDSYDLFLTDERILPLLPNMLGKYFFEKKKQPIPVNISKESNFKREILRACHCTYMYYSPGVCLSIKIGTTGMTSKQILENLEMAIPVIATKKRKISNDISENVVVPKKNKNSQLKKSTVNIITKKEEGMKRPLNKKVKEGSDIVKAKEGEEKVSNSVNVITAEAKDSNSKKGEGRAKNNVKVNITLEQKKTNGEGKKSNNTVKVKTTTETKDSIPKKGGEGKANSNAKVPKQQKANVVGEIRASTVVKEKITNEANDKNSKKEGGKANSNKKVNTIPKQKKANIGGEKKATVELKKSNFKQDESNSRVLDTASNEKKRKKTSEIKNVKSAIDATTNKKSTKDDDKKDPLDDKVSSFIAEQKKKIIEQADMNSNKNVVGNDKAKKKVAQEKPKGEAEVNGNGKKNGKSIKRKREVSGKNKPNKRK
ncbi:14112_t:CDS:10 [Funneliformis mosseae]|uniref:Ribosomal L1 domain-containing protein 1 n=1 Tax=Funneliformis mosseae TaxID=27381 RepID=A0A9N9CDL2_FUNMO|nr:14112_t:CDS:10 [Funneliformis mosseae]